MPLNYKDPVQLLHFIINKLDSKGLADKFFNHNQIANIVFGSGTDINQGYLSKVIHYFPKYVQFENKNSNKYKFDLERIAKEFSEYQNAGLKDKITQMMSAIDDEISVSIEDRKKHTYKILSFDLADFSNLKGIYILKLELEEDDYIKIYDGMPANIRTTKYIWDVEILEYDPKNSKLFVQSSYNLKTVLSQFTCYVEIDAVWLLEAIKQRLQNFKKTQYYPISKLLSEIKQPFHIKFNDISIYRGQLDEYQYNAMTHALKNDLTLIWGPPGTGKSYSLAYFLLNSMLQNEKTLVCCIANVAVDAIAKKLIDILEIYTRNNSFDYKNGNILRIGISQDNSINKLDFLFPNSKLINDLRKRIDILSDAIANSTDENIKVGLKGEKTDAKKELDCEIKSIISNAQIVFCTAAKVHSNSIFDDLLFENLIVDEASMMSVPHFTVLGQNISKRIILSGDFKQLSPVVLSNSFLAQKWLNQDLFEFSGLNYKSNKYDHPALIKLLIQRRFHEKICDLINKPFYNNLLKTEQGIEQTKLIKYIPAPGRSIAYYNIGSKKDYQCKVTKKGSRLNKFSADFIVNKILEQVKNHPILGTFNTIGIITPYRAQVNEINRLISLKDWNKYFKIKLMIGTIHSFQGSEADILIFDIVESKGIKLGKLYQHETGERLINVALTRVKSKLLIVGDIEAIIDNIGSNTLEDSVLTTLMNIKRYNFKYE